MDPNIHHSTMYNSQDMEATYMSIHGGMDTDVVHVYSGILTIKRNETVTLVETRMDLETVIYSEGSQREKKKNQVSYNFIFMWNLDKLQRWTFVQSRN